MDHNIIHDGALTVTLESNGAAVPKVGGACPNLDDVARNRAQARYICEVDDISESDQIWLDSQGEL